jgi:hypothetical protein
MRANSVSKKWALLAASRHKRVRIGVRFLVDGSVQALEVLFDWVCNEDAPAI